jgi:hypothetical protein
MKKFLLATVVILCGTQSFAEGSGWNHIGPLYTNGVTAFVDFQLQSETLPGGLQDGGPSSFQVTAAPLWINVQRPGLSASDRVHIVLINYVQSRYRGEYGASTQEVYEQDLVFSENGHFTGQVDRSPLISYQYNDGYAVSSRETKQELAIWINGTLYKDPSGQNFQFDMLRGSK